MLDLNILFSIRLIRFDRNLTARLIKKYLNNNQRGFTLVELIVVVVIIGILSSIAIPSFQNASEKAKQKEAASLVASYAKAAQAYYTEYSTLAISPFQLSEYVSIQRCRHNGGNAPQQCKSDRNAIQRENTNRRNHTWRSPSGNYRIFMRQMNANRVNWLAYPHSNSGLGVVGCYDSSSGGTRVQELPANQPGPGRVQPMAC